LDGGKVALGHFGGVCVRGGMLCYQTFNGAGTVVKISKHTVPQVYIFFFDIYFFSLIAYPARVCGVACLLDSIHRLDS